MGGKSFALLQGRTETEDMEQKERRGVTGTRVSQVLNGKICTYVYILLSQYQIFLLGSMWKTVENKVDINLLA